MALAGGAMLVAILILVVVSVVGRKILAMPVPGDVELTSFAAAIATAWFFPWCHIVAGDVKVDFFTNRWSPRTIAFLEAIGSLLIAVLALVIAWRTVVAAFSIHEAQEISAILAVPTWISYAGMVPGFALLALVALDSVLRHAREVLGSTPTAGAQPRTQGHL
jgi:TRAP-type C4-dicarboxylate transport system permease small subunit